MTQRRPLFVRVVLRHSCVFTALALALIVTGASRAGLALAAERIGLTVDASKTDAPGKRRRTMAWSRRSKRKGHA